MTKRAARGGKNITHAAIKTKRTPQQKQSDHRGKNVTRAAIKTKRVLR